MTTRESLSRQLDADPGNQSLRLILADVLDEEGEAELAEGMRWMVLHDRIPDWYGVDHGFSFYGPNPMGVRGDKSRSCLSQKLWFALVYVLFEVPRRLQFSSPKSRETAERALAQALLACGEINVKGSGDSIKRAIEREEGK